MNYLIDTNLISELAKAKPNSGVLDWLADSQREFLFLSTLTFGEIAKGLARNPARKKELEPWFNSIIKTWFTDRILNIDEAIALNWGNLVGNHPRTLPVIDALLAATAITHNLTLVTRNLKDFNDIKGLKVINPFA